jgi:hypothetical protein
MRSATLTVFPSRPPFLECLALLAAASALASAAPLTVSNGNSSITVIPDSVFGLSSWLVSGVENIFEQGYWFRLPDPGYEQPIRNLPLLSADAGISATNEINVHFGDSSLLADLRYKLLGGTPGRFSSKIEESVTLTNRTANPIPLNFFAETDLDLNGDAEGDLIFGNVVKMTQRDRVTAIIHANPTPDAFQIAAFPDLFLALDDFSPTNLDNTGSPFGPGDGTFAWQWNLVIPAGGVAEISIDKQIIPEPGTAGFLLLGLICLLSLRRAVGFRPKRASLR